MLMNNYFKIHFKVDSIVPLKKNHSPFYIYYNMLLWVIEKGLVEFQLPCQEFPGTLMGMCHSCKHHPSCTSPWNAVESRPLTIPQHLLSTHSLFLRYIVVGNIRATEWINTSSLQKAFSLVASQTRLGVICKSQLCNNTA